MSLTAPERETIISFSDDSQTAFVYSAQRHVITRLRKNPAAKLIEEGNFDGSLWARFELPAKLITFRAEVRLTAEQRQAKADRARAMRQNQLTAA